MVKHTKTHSTKKRKEAMLEALEKSLGVVTTAAKEAGIYRRTHYDWMEQDEEYADKVREMESAALDFAESKLFRKIQDGDTTSIIFYLKTKGKKRGYVERQEMDHTTGGHSFNVNIGDESLD